MSSASTSFDRPRDHWIAYRSDGKLYLSITNRRTLRCPYCPQFSDIWRIADNDPKHYREPTVNEILEAIGNPDHYARIVFCGLGEPTLRLYELLEVAARLRPRGTRIHVNTDGLANLVYGRDITPDLEGNVHSLSIALNAQDERTYNDVCRPCLPGSYTAMLDFAERASDVVANVTLTAIEGLPDVDLDACARLAEQRGIPFQVYSPAAHALP